MTPSYDPALNLTYWGVGNPGPDWNPDQRPGDNLYTDSVVALDADTGALKWHFQFSPNDPYDYDSVQIGVLADINWRGTPTKAMLWANRNGFFYVLDRTNGRFLSGTPFVKVNWASGLDDNGRPIPTPQPEGQPTWPGVQGGTNWYSPSFSPRTGLLYVSAWEGYASVFKKEKAEYVPGRNFLGGGGTPFTGVPGAPGVRVGRATPHQHLDRCRRQRRGHRHRPADRPEEMDLQAVRRHRQRQSDDGHRPAVHGRARGILLCARRADRRRAVEGKPRRPDRKRSDHLCDGREAVRLGDFGELAGHFALRD